MLFSAEATDSVSCSQQHVSGIAFVSTLLRSSAGCAPKSLVLQLSAPVETSEVKDVDHLVSSAPYGGVQLARKHDVLKFSELKVGKNDQM